MVYVISKDNKPLMPCSNPIARLLLKQNKAKVKKREPFTIKLTYETTNYPMCRKTPSFSYGECQRSHVFGKPLECQVQSPLKKV